MHCSGGSDSVAIGNSRPCSHLCEAGALRTLRSQAGACKREDTLCHCVYASISRDKLIVPGLFPRPDDADEHVFLGDRVVAELFHEAEVFDLAGALHVRSRAGAGDHAFADRNALFAGSETIGKSWRMISLTFASSSFRSISGLVGKLMTKPCFTSEWWIGKR